MYHFAITPTILLKEYHKSNDNTWLQGSLPTLPSNLRTSKGSLSSHAGQVGLSWMGPLVNLVKLKRFILAINGILGVKKGWESISLVGGLIPHKAMVPWRLDRGVLKLGEDRPKEGGLEGEDNYGVHTFLTQLAGERAWPRTPSNRMSPRSRWECHKEDGSIVIIYVKSTQSRKMSKLN